MDHKDLHIETLAIHGGQHPDPTTGAVMPPIYQTSTYAQEYPGKHKGFEYSRSQNPTRYALERSIASLEGGEYGAAFGSGLAAIDCMLKFLSPGDEVVACNDLYGGTYRLFTKVFSDYGIKFTFVDMSEEHWSSHISLNTKMVWMETPTNPMLNVLDIAQAARAFGIPILKAEVLARQKGFFKSGQQGGVDCAQVRQVLFGRELADVQAGEEAAQIAHFVRRQGALDLGEACICEIGEGQVLGGAHGGHADQQREDFGHREAGGCLHGLGVKLHATAAPAFGMDDKAFVTQGGDVAQERASGGADLFGELRDG